MGNCGGSSLVGIIHKKPKAGGISALGGTGSLYTYFGPEESKFATLTKKFLEWDLKEIMPSLGLANEPVPLWWTTDFINSSEVGTPEDQERWIVGEFNCSCVGISKCLDAYCNEVSPATSVHDIFSGKHARGDEVWLSHGRESVWYHGGRQAFGKSLVDAPKVKSDCIVDREGTPSFRPQSGWTHMWRSAEDRFLFLAGLFCFRSQPIVCMRCRSTIFPSFRLRRGPSFDDLPNVVARWD